MRQRLTAAGLLTILAGFALIFVGTFTSGGGSVGGVIFVGPVPLVFGAGPGGWELAIGSVVVGAVMVVLLLLWGRRLSQGWEP